jgi:hypothetical protein
LQCSPRGRQLITLRDAALYITKLPKAEHDAPIRLSRRAALTENRTLDSPGADIRLLRWVYPFGCLSGKPVFAILLPSRQEAAKQTPGLTTES